MVEESGEPVALRTFAHAQNNLCRVVNKNACRMAVQSRCYMIVHVLGNGAKYICIVQSSPLIQ